MLTRQQKIRFRALKWRHASGNCRPLASTFATERGYALKRSDLLLKAAPVAALVACGGGATGLLTSNPVSQLLRPKPTKGGSCGFYAGHTTGQIFVDLNCGDGWWARAWVDFSEKFHTVSDTTLEWCANPPSQCQFPNTVKLPIGKADSDWLKKKLIHLWKKYDFLPDPKGNGGQLYNGGGSVGSGSGSGTLTCDMALNAHSYGSGSYLEIGGVADLTTYGLGSLAVEKYKIPWGHGSPQYRPLHPTDGVRRQDGACLGPDMNCIVAFASFCVAVFTAETGIGAVLACIAYLNFAAQVVNAHEDGCF